MKILMWQETHPTVHGGAETWLKSCIAGLKHLGHSVAWLYSEQIELACHAFEPDVVILGTLHNFVGLHHAQYLLDKKIPAVWMMHDYWAMCKPRMLMRALNESDEHCGAVDGVCRYDCGTRSTPQQMNAIKELVNQFHIITGCEGAAEIMRRNGVNVQSVVEEGIDTDLFIPGHAEYDGLIYASAAGDEVWKGLHILRQTGMQVCFLTGKSQNDLAAAMQKACIYAFPSVYEEIWGLALTEAMSAGCAVVASDVAGAKAQIHEGLGILVAPRDVADLRASLQALIANPAEARETGKRAREHVLREHSLEAMGRRMERVCETARSKTCAV